MTHSSPVRSALRATALVAGVATLGAHAADNGRNAPPPGAAAATRQTACTANDTVAQCSDKLLKHCLQSYQGRSLPDPGLAGGSVGGVRLPAAGSGNAKVGFSLQEFQQTATATAAEARALSQQLAAYANQVELNAKKVLP